MNNPPFGLPAFVLPSRDFGGVGSTRGTCVPRSVVPRLRDYGASATCSGLALSKCEAPCRHLHKRSRRLCRHL